MTIQRIHGQPGLGMSYTKHTTGGPDAPRHSPDSHRTQAPPGRCAPSARAPSQADIGWPHTFEVFRFSSTLSVEVCRVCAVRRHRDHCQWVYDLPNGKRTRVQPAACEADLFETASF